MPTHQVSAAPLLDPPSVVAASRIMQEVAGLGWSACKGLPHVRESEAVLGAVLSQRSQATRSSWEDEGAYPWAREAYNSDSDRGESSDEDLRRHYCLLLGICWFKRTRSFCHSLELVAHPLPRGHAKIFSVLTGSLILFWGMAAGRECST